MAKVRESKATSCREAVARHPFVSRSGHGPASPPAIASRLAAKIRWAAELNTDRPRHREDTSNLIARSLGGSRPSSRTAAAAKRGGLCPLAVSDRLNRQSG
jgi:hypothetical protein